jgi:hypothetical protein
MDPSAQKRLEERIVEEVQTMLTEGDRTYLNGLSRDALLEALETELRFLGLYTHDDQETPKVIRVFLETHLDQWCEEYLWQEETPMPGEQQTIPEQTTPEMKVEIEESLLIQTSSSAGTGIPMTKVTHYIGFTPPIQRPSIQVG